MLLEAKRTPRDYLALEGVVVSGHVGRNVSRVTIDDATAYLKREHRVRWRDRYRQWRAGFGWVSLAVREATVLAHLAAHDVPVPIVLARGETDGQAFLLLAEVPDIVELQHAGPLPASFGIALGTTLARMHAAGVDQPDFFAKHVLINTDTHQHTLLDWQRATIRKRVTLAQRVRSLAALYATAFEAEPAWWPVLLATYQHEAGVTIPSAMLRKLAAELRQRPNIRQQRQQAKVAQTLVRIQGETVCAIPAVAADLTPQPPLRSGEREQIQAAIAALYEPCSHTLTLGTHTGPHRASRYWPFARILRGLRGKAWRSPELQAARVLFHLERYSILAPKLFAYGQRDSAAFIFHESLTATPLTNHDDASKFLDALHDAGCVVRDFTALGVCDGTIAVVDPFGVRLEKRLSSNERARQHQALAAWFEGRG